MWAYIGPHDAVPYSLALDGKQGQLRFISDLSLDPPGMSEKTVFEPKDRGRPLKAFVSPSERLAIENKAAAAGLSVSAYLRAVALGSKIEPVQDQHAILSLLKVNADLGRLGGLLKLWLTTRPGEGSSTVEVRRLLRDIEAQQIKLRSILDGL